MDGIQYGARTTRSNSNSGSMLAASNNANVNGSSMGSSNDQASASTSAATEAAGPICANCSTQTTSLWRRSAEGQTLCNACSLYQKMKGTPRPVSLKSDTIKHRNRSKGEKKVKDPSQSSKSSGKGKKAAGASRGASVNRASKPSSPAMRDVLEVDDEAYESHEEPLGMDSGNTSTASMHDALLVSQINARYSQKSPGTDHYPESNQSPGTSEYAAAAALASASASANANGRRSVSVDGREPNPHRVPIQQSPQITPLAPNIYNHYAYPSATPSSLFNGYTLGHQHMIPPILHPGYRTDIKNIYPYPPQQSVDAMNAMYFPLHRDIGRSHTSGHSQSQSPSAATSRNSSPRLASAHLPAAAVRQSSQSRQNSPQNQDVQSSSALSSQHTSQQSSSPYTNTPSVPSAAGPHRSASLDRYGVRHHSAIDRPTGQSEDSRSRPVAPTAKSGDNITGQEQESLSGRSSIAHPGSTSYHPYNLPLQRSQQRGMQNGSDSRASAGLPGRTSPGTFKQVRPGSSASSSSSSNDELKKGPASIYSPPFHPSISPNLPPIADAMVIDEEEAETAHILGQAARQSSSAERRGRSTTRKTRDGDTVAYGLSALRVRSSSRGDDDDRTQSPPFTKLTHSSIMVADLDDGIVRNAVTHRPISDMRDSASPGTTTLPSLSSALSSTASSRSVSGSRSTSRQSRKVPLAVHASSAAPLLPPPNTGYEEVARLRTRIQELEFINSLLENRVAELEAAKTPPVHSPSCSCRCSQASMDEDARLSERFREELASHGIQGLGDKQNKELFDLLHQRLGYQPGDLSK